MRWGAYDFSKELFDGGALADVGGGCGNDGVWNRNPYIDSFYCPYDDYAEWQDDYQPADPADVNNNWYSNLNKRQQFGIVKYYVDDPTITEVRMIADIPD